MSASPQISRRSEDVPGRGFGQVKTGHVMTTKISFYNRAASSDRDAPETPSQRRRIVRFEGVDSSGSLSPVGPVRPQIKTGDVAVNIRQAGFIPSYYFYQGFCPGVGHRR